MESKSSLYAPLFIMYNGKEKHTYGFEKKLKEYVKSVERAAECRFERGVL